MPPDLAVTHLDLDAGRGYDLYQPPQSPASGFAALCGKFENLRLPSKCAEAGNAVPPPTSGAGLLWARYQESGVDAFRGLKGVFTAIVADLDRRCIHLFRSPLLGRPLFYFLSREWFITASDAHAVWRHPAVGGELDDSWLACFFEFQTPSNASTPFRSVGELLPGELLTVTRGGFEIARDAPGFGTRRVHFRREQDYVERFDELVSRAVARQVKGRMDIGIMLSGGLDSVPAAWWMRRHMEEGGRLAAYSWSLRNFPAADESALIEESADMIDIPAHMLVGDELWPLSNLKDWPLCPDSPQQNAFRLLKQSVYRLAASNGCRFIFNGNYGDNLYPGYHHVLADALYGGKPGRFARELKLLAETEGLWGLYRHGAIRQIAKKALGWRSRTGDSDFALTAFANGLIDRERDWPPEARDHPRPDQYRTLLGTHTARDINGEEFFTDPYEIELVEPYVDWDLVDFMLSVPSYVFWNFDESKVLMRRAMRGRIPQPVLTRPQGGLLHSFFDYGMNKGFDWIKQRLFGAEVDWPRFADRRRIEQALESGTPGERESMLIWQCVTYEMWLDRYFR
jgi:asparagine synthase (glutamine-hydrolysing)